MPVLTCDGRTLFNVVLAETVGKKCSDGRYHVILDDGTCGIWISEAAYVAEREAEDAKHAEIMLDFLKPKKRKINLE